MTLQGGHEGSTAQLGRTADKMHNVASGFSQHLEGLCGRVRNLAARIHLVANDALGVQVLDQPPKSPHPEAVASNTRQWFDKLVDELNGLEAAVDRLDR